MITPETLTDLISIAEGRESPSQRGALLLWRHCFDPSPDQEDDAAARLREILSDVRHACDLMGLSFSDVDREAHQQYIHQLVEAQE